MSYSFTVKAATKAEAKAAVEAAFDKVVASQPIHARDKAAALANVGAMIDLLVDAPAQDIAVSCSGSVSWHDQLKDDVSNDLAGVSVNGYAYLVARE